MRKKNFLKQTNYNTPKDIVNDEGVIIMKGVPASYFENIVGEKFPKRGLTKEEIAALPKGKTLMYRKKKEK